MGNSQFLGVRFLNSWASCYYKKISPPESRWRHEYVIQFFKVWKGTTWDFCSYLTYITSCCSIYERLFAHNLIRCFRDCKSIRFYHSAVCLHKCVLRFKFYNILWLCGKRNKKHISLMCLQCNSYINIWMHIVFLIKIWMYVNMVAFP